MTIEAVCVLRGKKPDSDLQGIVVFKENSKSVTVTLELSGLTPGLHGFHIHESGDLRDGCNSLCAHYNPHSQTHGGRSSKTRHMGDLGNVKADKNGTVKMTFRDSKIRLTGKYSIVGRSLIVHEDEDDLGLGGNEESLKTGNAGKRIMCGVIGWSRRSTCS